MPIVRRVKRSNYTFQIVKRMLRRNEITIHELDVEAQRTADRERVAQPIHFVFGIGKAERSAAMPGHWLSGFLLQHSRIQTNVVVDHSTQAVGRC